MHPSPDYSHLEVFLVLKLQGRMGYAWKYKDYLRRSKVMFKSYSFYSDIKEIMVVTFFQSYPNWGASLLNLRLKYGIEIEILHYNASTLEILTDEKQK